MRIDLAKYSAVELDVLIGEAEKQKILVLEQQREAARKRVSECAKSLGYTVEELFGDWKRGSRTRKAVIKYQNPADPSQTWSGRGKPAKWFKQALANGVRKEDLTV